MPHFTPITFARRCGAEALQSLLAYEAVTLVDIDWSSGPRKLAESVVAGVAALPAQQRNALNAAWQEIHCMANDHGVRCLIEEAKSIPAFAQDAVFRGLSSNHQRVVHMWCHYHRIWVTSKRLAATEELSNTRYWHERPNVPAKPALHDPDTCTALGAAISSVFASQLRAQHYRIEPHPCEDGSCYYFAILKDLPTTDEVFNPAGDDLVPIVRERVFEIVIWCPAMGGLLACHIEGGADRTLRESVFAAFAQAVFKVPLPDIPPKHPMENRWKLDHLLTKGTLPADPASGAMHGQVLALTVTALGRGHEKVTFEADPSKGPDAMQAAIKAWIDLRQVPLMTLRVIFAKLCLTWPSQGSRRKTMTWEVSLPGRCTLKSQRDERRAIGEHHMLAWGIDVLRTNQRTDRTRPAA